MGKFRHILKSLRIKENLSQEELANKLGVSRSTIGMYEQGKREPDLEGMETIADLFNVDMNYLTGNSDTDYYVSLQVKQIAQEIYNNNELKLLFDEAKNVDKEGLLALIEIMKKFKKN